MKNVDLYGRVRHAVLIDGMSSRGAARIFGVGPRTVAKMLAFSVPPGYRRSQPAPRPKLDAFTGIIDQILEADKLVPKKQRHTSKRIFERLRGEYRFTGGITIVKDYIFTIKQRQRETGSYEQTIRRGLIELLIETLIEAKLKGRTQLKVRDFVEQFSSRTGLTKKYSPFTAPDFMEAFDSKRLLELSG